MPLHDLPEMGREGPRPWPTTHAWNVLLIPVSAAFPWRQRKHLYT